MGGFHRRAARRVDGGRVLGTARVLGAATIGAVVVTLAIRHAIGAPPSAHVVGKCEGVLGDVGLLAVAANAAVGQFILQQVVGETGISQEASMGNEANVQHRTSCPWVYRP